MNCETAQNLLDSYADGELDLLNHLEIEKHLQNCPSCEREFQNRQTLKSAFDDSMRFHASPDLRKRIQTALRETNQESPSNKFLELALADCGGYVLLPQSLSWA